MTAIRTAPTKQHEVLIALGRERGWRMGAEIVVLKGKTLRHLLAALPELTMIAVDQWAYLPASDEDGHETYEAFDLVEAERLVREIAAQYPGRCQVLKGDSLAMAARVEDASLDFVFLDAAHTKAQTLANIAAWAAKVRPGGLITGHDWWWAPVAAALEIYAPGAWARHAESVWSIERAG